MTKKKSEIKVGIAKKSFFERHSEILKFSFVTIITGLLVFGIYKICTFNSLQKDQAYNYVCQIVGADTELGMMAMKCMAK